MRIPSAIDRRRSLGLLTLLALSAHDALAQEPPEKGATAPIDLTGRPDAKALGDETRLVLWRDAKEGNLHVQAVARGAAASFRGTVVAVGGAIRDVEGLETLESAKRSKKGAVKNADSADRVEWKKDKLDFRFHTVGGKTDEITIRLTPETTDLKLTLLIDGKAAHKRIFLGKAGTHPDRDIVVVPFGK